MGVRYGGVSRLACVGAYLHDVLPLWVWRAEFLPLYALLGIEAFRPRL
jgi:hypothetical protein